MSGSSCPCHSGVSYESCCGPLHKGSLAKDPLSLMRSRYSAYALGFSTYIMDTTHLENSSYAPLDTPERKKWAQSIALFSAETRFLRLEILHIEKVQKGPLHFPFLQGTVTFVALLEREGMDLSFEEKSIFIECFPPNKKYLKWLYHSALYIKKLK